MVIIRIRILSLDKERKLNVNKKFRRRPDVFLTSYVRPNYVLAPGGYYANFTNYFPKVFPLYPLLLEPLVLALNLVLKISQISWFLDFLKLLNILL